MKILETSLGQGLLSAVSELLITESIELGTEARQHELDRKSFFDSSLMATDTIHLQQSLEPDAQPPSCP